MNHRTLRNVRSVLVGVGATLLLATGFAGVYRLADDLAWRIDLTATQSHSLSAETLALLGALPAAVDIAVLGTVDEQRLDPWSARRVRDTLEEIARRSGNVRVRWIDPASAQGPERARALLEQLAARDADRLESARRSLETAIERLAEASEAASGATPPTELAGQIRAATDEIRRRLQTNSGLLDRRVQGVPIPAIAQVQDGLAGIAIAFDRIIAALTEAGLDASSVRGPLALARDQLGAITGPEPSAASVASVLASTPAVIVASERGSRAIPLESVFPPRPADESVGIGADAGPRAEAAVVRALRELLGEPRPLVVFTHGEAGDVLRQTNVLDAFQRRLDETGFELVQWAPVTEPEPPAVVSVAGDRPVVFVVIGTDAGADAPGPGRSGPERAAAVARGVRYAIENGHPALVSVAPSQLPAFGTRDPVAASLEAVGVEADTARPLLRHEATPRGRVATPELDVVGRRRGPLGPAIDGLGLRFPWAVPLSTPDESDSCVVVDADDAWAETVWQTYRTIAPERRPLVANPPTPDPERGETAGPWQLVATLEANGPRPRLVVVGSNRWFFDDYTTQAALLDGRVALTYPGNSELLAASLDWLVGREPVAREVQAVPRIRGLSESGLFVLQVASAVGLPLLVLCVGGAAALLGR